MNKAKKYIDTLKLLVNKTGVSGYESDSEISNAIFNSLQKISRTKNYIDSAGNVVSIIGNGKKKVIIDAHIDEVGFIVSNLNDKAILAPIGTIDAALVKQKKVRCVDKNIIENTGSINNELSIKNKNRDLKCGDVLTFDRIYKHDKKKNTISATALDNRAGCAALVQIIRTIALPKDMTLIAVFSTRQEIHNSSILHFINKYKPDFGIVIDAAYAQPIDIDPNIYSIPIIGNGAAVQYKGHQFVVPKQIINLINDISQKKGIVSQPEIPPANTGKTTASHFLQKNIPVGVINIPVRNQHESISTMNINDALAAISLIKELIPNIATKLLN